MRYGFDKLAIGATLRGTVRLADAARHFNKRNRKKRLVQKIQPDATYIVERVW